MTVSSQTNKIRIVGNGVADAFPLPFRFFANSEISALFVERATGVTTPAAIGTDYTLTGAGDPEVNGSATGVLTTTVPLAATRDLIILRTLPTTQQTDIVNQGEFFASTHEDVFDRLTMIAQQQQEELSRAVKASVSDTITPDQLLDSIRQSEQTAVAAAASASSSAASAAQSFDDFDDRYLGGKAADPTTDNDGQPLQEGALYWNTVSSGMRVWTGGAWEDFGGGAGATGGGNDQAFLEGDALITQSYIIGQNYQKPCTISIASPAVITQANTFVAGQPVWFNSAGSLPAGITPLKDYYVLATGLSATSFQIAATPGGAAINTIGTQSGSHTCGPIKNAITPGDILLADGVEITAPDGAVWSIV